MKVTTLHFLYIDDQSSKISFESKSSVNAQFYGWKRGFGESLKRKKTLKKYGVVSFVLCLLTSFYGCQDIRNIYVAIPNTNSSICLEHDNDSGVNRAIITHNDFSASDTSSEQDDFARKKFVDISKNEEYHLLFPANHCSTTVERALMAASIKLGKTTETTLHIRPSKAYKNIKQTVLGYVVKRK